MSTGLPLAEPEGERLELKAREVLREPEKVAREAVAMLNSKGGEIWIGIGEAEDRREVEPIPDAERERRRLQDRLLDVIEPRPTSSEIAVTVEGRDSGGPVLLVAVEPQPGRGPYALLRSQGGRYYLRRFGDRIVPMSREEIFAASGASPSGEPREAVKALKAAFDELLATRREGFWLRLEPEGRGELSFSHLADSGLLTDPTLTGTPRSSYNFTAAAYHGDARLEEGKALRMGDDDLSLRLFRTGGIELTVTLGSLWVGNVPFVEAERLLSPEAVLGYSISVLRLASGLFQDGSIWEQAPSGGLWVTLAVVGLQGWGLLPGDLSQWPSRRHQIQRFDAPDFLMDEPLFFSHEDILERPDDCGRRIVRRLYEGFNILRDLPSIRSAFLLP